MVVLPYVHLRLMRPPLMATSACRNIRPKGALCLSHLVLDDSVGNPSLVCSSESMIPRCPSNLTVTVCRAHQCLGGYHQIVWCNSGISSGINHGGTVTPRNARPHCIPSAVTPCHCNVLILIPRLILGTGKAWAGSPPNRCFGVIQAG